MLPGPPQYFSVCFLQINVKRASGTWTGVPQGRGGESLFHILSHARSGLSFSKWPPMLPQDLSVPGHRLSICLSPSSTGSWRIAKHFHQGVLLGTGQHATRVWLPAVWWHPKGLEVIES